MSVVARPADWSPSAQSVHDMSSDVADMPSISPQPSLSPSFPDTSSPDGGSPSPRDQQVDPFASRPDQTGPSKIKKKFSELDIRGAMADLDIRKSGGKRVGIEDFYIQLEDPHRMFYLPGDVVKGTTRIAERAKCGSLTGHVHLILDKPVKTQFVMLQLTGLLSGSMVREKIEYPILEEECVLWGTKTASDRTSSPKEEYETPKKEKEGWETGIMDEGEHPFPFEFSLPAKSMPSSIDVFLTCPNRRIF